MVIRIHCFSKEEKLFMKIATNAQINIYNLFMHSWQIFNLTVLS